MFPFSLEGKTIVVTGASSGIGAATAIECSKMGARIILVGRNEKKLNDTKFQLNGSENHCIISADITDEKQLKMLVEQCPVVDGVVHSAGISIIKPFNFASKEQINKTFDINFYAPVELTRLFLKAKKLVKGASVVFISSISGGIVTNFGYSAYTASKSALTGIANTIALELAPKGIRVNCISPGTVKTDLLEASGLTQEQISTDEKNYPMGRYGRTQEIAWAVIYFLSPAANWTTGANLVIDGGYTLR